MPICYLLDTNILSYLIREPQGIIYQKLKILAENEISTSIIVASELRYGAARRESAQLTAKVDDLLSCLTVLPLGVEVDQHYAEIRSLLEQQGQIIGGNDLWIAAHARALDLILVSNNIKEFQRVPKLKLENWFI